MRQGSDNFSLDWDSMGVNLVIECFAEGDGVFSSLADGDGLVAVMKPEMELIKKVKTH